MLTGYHYTSYDNWLKIREEGLIPYHIYKEGLLAYYFPQGVDAIWVFKQDFTGLKLFGAILWQCQAKNCTQVVKLRVSYYKRDVLTKYMTETKKRHSIKLTHDADIWNLVFHKKEPADLLKNRIPPDRVEFVDMYDITMAWDKR